MSVFVSVTAAFVISMCGLFTLHQPGSDHSDQWAAWVQAGGSVLAVLVALWVAIRANQQRLDELNASAKERIEERLAASMVTARVVVAQLHNIVLALEACKQLLTMNHGIHPAVIFGAVKVNLFKNPRPTEEQLLRLMAAPAAVRDALFVMIDKVQSLDHWVNVVTASPLPGIEMSPGPIEQALSRFQTAEESVSAAMRELMKFSSQIAE